MEDTKRHDEADRGFFLGILGAKISLRLFYLFQSALTLWLIFNLCWLRLQLLGVSY